MEKVYIRVYIKTRWLLGLTAVEIHGELLNPYGHECVLNFINHQC
jgi:hypothetical protein